MSINRIARYFADGVETVDSRANRLPPYSAEAEMGLVGSVLCANNLFDELADSFNPDHLFCNDLRLIFDASKSLYSNGDVAEPIAVKEILERRGQLGKAGGLDRIWEVQDAGAVHWNARHYAGIVTADGLRREAIRIGVELIEGAYLGEIAGDALLQQMADEAIRVSTLGSADSVMTLAQISQEWKEVLRRRQECELEGLSSGFRDIDLVIGGYGRGRVIVLAGRPGQGKSAYAMNSAEKMSVFGARGLIVSQEMGRLEVFERMVSSRGKIDNIALRDMAQEPDDRSRQRIYDSGLIAAKSLEGLPLSIDDTPGRTVSQVEAVCRRMKSKQGLDYLMVDYLQLMEAEPGVKANRQEIVAKMSRRFKLLARSLDIPVLLLSQLNRAAESREDKRPKMADLRESGAIEQDADQVLFIHRPEYYDPGDSPGIAEVIVSKNRFGPTKTTRLLWCGPITTFTTI